MGGAVGPATSKIDSGPGLQVLDPATGEYRFTNGLSQFDPARSADQRALDEAAAGVTNNGIFGQNARKRLSQANARTGHTRYMTQRQESPWPVRGGARLAEDTRKVFESFTRPSRMMRGDQARQMLDGYDQRIYDPYVPREEPKTIDGVFPAFDLVDSARAAGDGNVRTFTVNGRQYYAPTSASSPQHATTPKGNNGGNNGNNGDGAGSSGNTDTIMMLVLAIVLAIVVGYSVVHHTSPLTRTPQDANIALEGGHRLGVGL